ncbi:MAG: amino acid-binding protein [Rhodospirillales bacterium]|nr:amino acid-binding protein [Rhodospirillales bacterium]
MGKLGKYRLAFATLAGSLAFSAYANAADVVIGVPNWPSVRATANILKVVMEDNLGLDVELQNGTNPVVFEAMDKNSMHVHPEVWLPNQSNLHNTFVNDKGTVAYNTNGIEGFQGICVPKAYAEANGVTTIEDLIDPDKAALFDGDGDGKGEIWIGAPGWASTNVEKIRAKSYGYGETLELLEMDETLALAALDKAVQQNSGWVGFCYAPHHMFVLHTLQILEEPAYDAAKWTVLQPTDDPNWLEKSDAAVAWDLAYLHLHYARALEESAPEAVALLQNYKLDTDTLSGMTYALVVEKQDPVEFARKWVAENPEIVNSWLQ